ncbi:hypothetical protein DPMN_133675 [Dreissena polymorpha]|uniref:C1q domain-containing protein n=1 Tax=Dreissena polymorpha TaxID=45954 RepID=A0A9D4JF19_DREPO|nr:hypothetical protein DPMN_133675 [Dreissena polymorpha]
MHLQKKGLIALLQIIVATCAREPSSPICSRYDYEERLLERVLRNELALETTLNEIVKTNAKVLDALTQLEDAKTKVDSTLTVMEKKQIEMKSQLADFISNASYIMNSTLVANVGALVEASSQIKENASVTVQQLVKEVNILKDQLNVPTIYFRARITAQITVLSSGQDVVFPTVDVNEGQGYNPSTGKFTASIPGMYLFSVQYCVYTSLNYVYLEIVHGDKALQRSTHYDNTGSAPCVTMQVSAAVAMGDMVWVRATGSSSLYANTQRYSSFAGTLIHV